MNFGNAATFKLNQKAPLHRWYPYLEGFSDAFVTGLLEHAPRHIDGFVYDPFAGTGTTALAAARSGRGGRYSEVNPFMRLVIETKSIHAFELSRDVAGLSRYFDKIIARAAKARANVAETAASLHSTFGPVDYFPQTNLREIAALRQSITDVPAPSVGAKRLALLSLGAIAVESSNLIRAGDLRYRRDGEPAPRSALDLIRAKFDEITCDVTVLESSVPDVRLMRESALDPVYEFTNTCALVITSPPYLNGTNYCRNTKLELWITGIIQGAEQWRRLRDGFMAAGINTAKARDSIVLNDPWIDELLRELRERAYDRRIPVLVAGYIADSVTWTANVFSLLKPGGRLFVDIGDSRFGGVHVPTPNLLAHVAKRVGFSLLASSEIRKRRSRDGSPLQQMLLEFEKPKEHRVWDFSQAARSFSDILPYKMLPFSKRNWGDERHSICSYQGKLKPALAHFLVREFTNASETVLDPMSGAGTIPLEVHLQGRCAVANDISDLAYILTCAKVESGDGQSVLREMERALDYVRENRAHFVAAEWSDFGYNGKIVDYFHKDTMQEILAFRDFISKHPCDSWAKAIVYSSFLHILHGNRPYALSRRSHPVTPFSPSGPCEYRGLEARLREKVFRTLGGTAIGQFNGAATQGDLFSLRFNGDIDVVLTSPPFFDSTRFISANWLRLWATGWARDDFRNEQSRYIEHLQRRDFDLVYTRFFEAATRWLRPNGRIVLHLGASAKIDMAHRVSRVAAKYFDVVHVCSEDVSGAEKFGISDQGAVNRHQFVFLSWK